jgi:hypothetical protein
VRMICERAEPACGTIMAHVNGWVWCMVCPETHKISPTYSPMRYALTEKARREAKIKAGFCAECGRRRDTISSRLCARHLAMKRVRKRRYDERRNLAVKDSLYSGSSRGMSGGAVITYDLRDETAGILL